MADPIFFKVHRNELLAALAVVMEAVESKSTILILSNVLLRPNGDDLEICGTNLNIEVNASCPLLDAGSGKAVTVLGADLYEITRKLPESAEMSFAAGTYPDKVSIKAGSARFTLLALPESDFPSIATKATGDSFNVDILDVMSAIGKVTFAIRDDETRHYLAGVCMHPFDDGNKIAVAGTDGHCLAVVRIPTLERVDFPWIIIPSKTVKALKKLTADRKGRMSITVSEAMIRFECAGTILVSKLIDGTYPDYSRVIPGSNDKDGLAVVSSLKAALGRVCIVIGDAEKDSVRMHIDTTGINLALSTPGGEEASESIGAEYADDPITFGFKGAYMINILGVISTQDVRISFSDASTPAIFRPTIDADELFVLSPRRL